MTLLLCLLSLHNMHLRTERLQKQRIQINRLKKELQSEAAQNHA